MKLQRKPCSHFLSLLLASVLSLVCAGAMAQAYPAKPIKFVLGYPPGGATDQIARIVAQKLTERLPQPVIVENKPGADSLIAGEYVAKSAPDGYTFLIVGISGMVNFNPALPRMPYDALKDFVPVTQVGGFDIVFAVNPSVPANSMKEYVALAKAKPGTLFYGAGAPPFFMAAELLKKQAGVDITHVPFKGSAQSITAAMAGDVSLVVVDLPPTVGQIKGGKLRALAVTGSTRSSLVPEVPTLSEVGLDLEGGMWLGQGMWMGLFAPAGTPRTIIDKLYGELAVILKSDDLKAQYTAMNLRTNGMGTPPAEFASFLKVNLEKWAKVKKDLKIAGD